MSRNRVVSATSRFLDLTPVETSPRETVKVAGSLAMWKQRSVTLVMISFSHETTGEKVPAG